MEQNQKLTPAQLVEKLRKDLADAEAALRTQQEDKLKEIPSKHGYGSVLELIQALIPLTNGEFKLAKARKGGKKPISDDIKTAIVEELGKKDKLSDAKIAKKFNVSTASISNIKKAAGLVKKDK
jgi:hypothetical protein